MRRLGLVVLFLVIAGATVELGGVGRSALAFGEPSPEEARAIAVEAYLYGYPLVTMEMTRRVMTNVPSDDGQRAPMGQLARMRTYPGARNRGVPAADTDGLSTTAWVDVSREPYVLSLPDMQGRYFLFSMFDGWTTVFQDPGTRTTGTGPQKFVITGPEWKGGQLPDAASHVVAPTGLVWMVGRIFSRGRPEDIDAVHALQDQTSLVPLSAYGQPYAPPRGSVDARIDTETPVRAQVDALDAAAFFGLMSALMASNPPQKDDQEIVGRMAKIGLVPGKPFSPTKLSARIAAAIDGVRSDARAQLRAEAHSAAMKEEGWRVLPRTGRYGKDYALRALVAAAGLGANLPEDVVYPLAVEDDDAQPLDGARRYVMHFEREKLPPARGFWSLTMYDEEMYLVDNPLHRHALGQASALAANPDGSVDVLLQPDSPGPDRERNWLPSRAGKFLLMLRLYWPNERPPTILDGTWRPPKVRLAP